MQISEVRLVLVMMQHALKVLGTEWRCATCTGRDKKPPVPLLQAPRRKLLSQNPPNGNAVQCGRLKFNPSVSDFGDDSQWDVDSIELPYLQSYDPGCVGDAVDSDPAMYDEITDTSGKSLKHCARKLQEFAIKTQVKLSFQDEDDHETSVLDEMFEVLRSAESACDVVLNARESTENISPTASKSTVAMSRSLAVHCTDSRPSTWRSYRMDSSRAMVSQARDRTGANSHGIKSEGVNSEYERRDVSSMIEVLRSQMREEGILQDSKLSTDSAKLAEVHAYQEVMRSKFEALGVQGARVHRFRTTAKSTEAVRDAVAAYHTHCQKLGRFYAMPGDAPEAHGLHAYENEELTKYAQVLNSRKLPPR